MLAAVLTTGRRTVTNLLRTVRCQAQGHVSSYHRVRSQRRWSTWALARTLITFRLDHVVPSGPVLLAGDETVTEHPGPHVFGQGRHRDGVRSTPSYTAYRWGHKWVVDVGAHQVARVPPGPGPYRSWWPCTVRRNGIACTARGIRRQPTSPGCCWPAWYAGFRSVTSSLWVTRAMARARRPDCAVSAIVISPWSASLMGMPPLSEPPPRRTRRTIGRPRVNGQQLPSPQEVVAHSPRRTRLAVAWSGGTSRDIEIVTGRGHWYRIGEDLVAIRWVYVHDCTGTHRDEYLFTTDRRMCPNQMVECSTQRWSIETTFQEGREPLKLESTKCYSQHTVLRFTPCLLGL